jgi:hypothetical protein
LWRIEPAVHAWKNGEISHTAEAKSETEQKGILPRDIVSPKNRRASPVRRLALA